MCNEFSFLTNEAKTTAKKTEKKIAYNSVHIKFTQ